MPATGFAKFVVIVQYAVLIEVYTLQDLLPGKFAVQVK